MAELLLELFSEEIPARMQAKAADDLKRLVEEGLKKAGLEWTRSEAFVTPRRLALVIDGLPEIPPEHHDEKKGPTVGAPEQAINGFLKSAGISSVDDCEIRDVKGKPTYFFVKVSRGPSTRDILLAHVNHVVREFPWQKSMRWGRTNMKWVRPLHSILFVFNGQSFSGFFADRGFGSLDLLPDRKANPELSVPIGHTTFGHRFLNPGPIAVTDFADYRAKLAAAHVLLCPSERRAEIVSQAEKLAEHAGYTLRPDEGLLQEVTGLVEWPVVLMGAIDDEFMDVPAEVLTTTMRVNQKYFTLLNADGSLAPKFIVVANQVAVDGGKAIQAGNERVLRARLSDAKFFWDQDLKTPLALRTAQLKDIVFHAKLGTVADKVSRIVALAEKLASSVGAHKADAIAAAQLCKADLVTGMVGEFPELQGVMGRYYALAGEESTAVADAIRDHYSPLGPNDLCPNAPVSVAVALADKIDTLVGFWTIDEKPTGSKDPFALRRAALGVIRLIIENKLRLKLLSVFDIALSAYPPNMPNEEHSVAYNAAKLKALNEGAEFSPRYYVASELLSFFADRLKVHLKTEGVRHDLIDAVFSLGGEDDLVRLLARVDALGALMGTDDGLNLLAAHKRATNILRIEEKKDGVSYLGVPDPALFALDEERALSAALASAGAEGQRLAGKELFADAMAALATLRAPLDAFFDAVMVNVDDQDVRKNRLKLLSQILTVTGDIADFSKIGG
ncbi:MAG: glycine--tRNA ligase subunit beta [Rhodospirillales bacterium]|nr:glycine--tRNA ligase subunit beta [Rhodospirillales bacterium]